MRIEVSKDLSEMQLARWQKFLIEARHSHPEQNPRFAEVLRADGNEVLFTMGWEGDALRVVAMFSLRPNRVLRGHYGTAIAYSGPVCDDLAVMAAFLSQLCLHPSMAKVGRLRVTPYWIGDDAKPMNDLLAQGGWIVFEGEKMRHTGLIDLRGTEADILARFSKSARSEARKAEKLGITVDTVQDEAGAEEFLESLNRHRNARRMGEVARPGFLASVREIHKTGDLGTILVFRYQGVFVAGLLVYRSPSTVHLIQVTNEADKLQSLKNLRISPYLCLEGMRWAKARGCDWMDVEGYKENTDEDDKYRRIYRYKAELGPIPVLRVAGQQRILNYAAHLTGNAGEIGKKTVSSMIRTVSRKAIGKSWNTQ